MKSRDTIAVYVVKPCVILGFCRDVRSSLFWGTQHRLVVTSANLRCVTSQKSEDLIVKTIESLFLSAQYIFMIRTIHIHITKRFVMKMRWVSCEMGSKCLRMTWASNSGGGVKFFRFRRLV